MAGEASTVDSSLLAVDIQGLLAVGNGSALAVGLDMAGDETAADAERGLDVRLVLAVLLAVQCSARFAEIDT
jgi:hypothetical protein